MAYHFPFYFAYRLGIISDGTFRKPWPTHLGWYIRSYTTEEADQVWAWVVDTLVSKNWREDVCQELNKHRNEGYLTVLVSGTPIPLLQRIADEVGAEHCVGTGLEIKAGKFTGHSSGPACIAEKKVTLTKDFLEKDGIEVDFEASYAYADSASDKYLLEMVGHPVATYPDQGLRQIAMERSWQIIPPQTTSGST